MDRAMRNAVSRSLDGLSSPLDSAPLGSSLVREVIYRALLGGHGKALAAVSAQDTQHARIARVLAHLHELYMSSISVDRLCNIANKGPSTVHRAFKSVAGDTPLQYQKKVRLENARFLIVREGTRVSDAANRVGYESVSQFSREFKRDFAVPPNKASTSAYAEMYS